jgi:carbonic anhydrase/acetyltransferase-like protein (isoleucine patch superfamily)
VTIETRCNIQDGVIIHALGGTGVTIGRQTSLSHGCVIHGPCTIGQNCFIGFKSVVYDAILHDGVFVGTAAVVQSVTLQPDCSVRPASVIVNNSAVAATTGPLSSQEIRFMDRVINANLKLTRGYNHKQGHNRQRTVQEWKSSSRGMKDSAISVK